MNTLKNIGAVIAAFIVVAGLSTITDLLLGYKPGSGNNFSPALFGLALFYRSVYAIAGGYVAALLAPSRPMRLVIIVGAIGTVLAIAGVFASLNDANLWYPVGLAITAFPCTWLGGRLRVQKRPAALLS